MKQLLHVAPGQYEAAGTGSAGTGCLFDLQCARINLVCCYGLQIVALPYLHQTISTIIDSIYSEKKTVELDVEALKQASK